MIIRIVVFCLACISLAACAKKPVAPKSVPNTQEAVNVTLAEAATSVSHSLNEVAATEQAANPPQSVSEPPSPSSYGMNVMASVNWQGPVEPILKKLAQMTNYKFRIIGQSPSSPVIVDIFAKNQEIGDIVRNIGLQAAKRAQVVVMPVSKTLELRYREST